MILTMLFVGTFSAFAGNNLDSDAVDSSQSDYWENVMNEIIQEIIFRIIFQVRIMPGMSL